MAKLENVSLFRAPAQLRPAHRFVDRHRFELSRNSPSTIEDFGSYFSTVVSLARYSINPNIEKLIVREDRTNRMMGIATVIPNVVIEPIEGQPVTGSYLDYVMSDSASEPIHDSVSEALLRWNKKFVLKITDNSESGFDNVGSRTNINVIAANRFPERDSYGVPNRGLLRVIPPLTDVVSLQSVESTGLAEEGFELTDQIVFHYMSNREVR